ncbi:MAG: hypothetical protein FD157_14 [Rhodocyclaceae bacterium]|nr:MAG: hypothetical protein FD157_14 [Rhodocyclaceae bacterium]TND00046.1 MAG: hypothetical protein FD118_3448 [Rhodocyclaceae bacterium]
MMNRRRRSLARKQHGFLLIALLALIAMGGLYFFISNLTPELLQARRQQQTSEALTQAREAVLGYAVRYRESQLATGTSGIVYGYLPLPDLGSTRNNNQLTDSSCYGKEGCEAYNFSGNGINVTVIGRFPWRTLGTGPLRDANGECLWYAVSGSHQRNQPDPARPMNWDTLSQMDVVVANGTAAMVSAVASAHDRPIAVIFSPGPPLAGQDRSASATDTVTECGGNYVVGNYLDPVVATDLAGVTNYLAGTTNSASGDTSAANKSLSAGGAINRRSDGTLGAGSCPPNDTAACTIVANDTGAAITGEQLFRTLRGSSYFRTDINAMLDQMSTCLRDQIAAGSALSLQAPAATHAEKSVGRIPDSSCYGNDSNPLGYFNNYKDQFFLASCSSGSCLNVSVDGVPGSCVGALLFAGQRGVKSPVPTDSGESLVQLRNSDAVSATNLAANTNWPANYLEGSNLTSFITEGQISFTGPSQFSQVSTSHPANQDIVRCVPAGPSLTVAAPVVAASAGNIQLAAYAPATSALTLGSAAISSNYGASTAALSACAWTPETHAAGTGFRSYFRFRIRKVGEGFTFAVIDGDRNAANACGAARQHLGYSGDSGNASFPYIQWPKLAIEFDTSRNCNSGYIDANGHPACTFIEAAYTDSNTLSNGRNDPCYTGSCGGQIGYNNSHHVAVVYWGYGSALNYPTQDDNAHDQADDNSGATPSTPMPTDPSPRPGPRNPAPVLPYVANPATIPGIAPYDRMGNTDVSQREFHARLEVTRTFTAPVDAKDGTTGVQVQFWIEPHSAKSISAMTYNAGSPPTLTVTVTPIDGVGHGLSTGDTVVIKDAVPAGYNGEYPATVIDANSFTATLPNGTANPGRYISAITWTKIDFFTDQATVTSANHGLINGNSITIAGAIPTEYNGTHAITWISANSYRFGLELNYQPGTMAPAIAAPKALTPRAIALANTTRPMSVLDATAKPLVSHAATIYDEQKSACAASAPLCPNGQSCGSDNMCYQPSFRNLRLGFTVAERASSSGTARGQLIEIKDRSTTWLP